VKVAQKWPKKTEQRLKWICSLNWGSYACSKTAQWFGSSDRATVRGQTERVYTAVQRSTVNIKTINLDFFITTDWPLLSNWLLTKTIAD